MGLQKALVFSNKVPESGIARHTSFTHFLDLIDACGYDLKITSGQPSNEALATYKIIFLDVSDYPSSALFQHALFTSEYKHKIVLFDAERAQKDVELTALKNGVKGVFYIDDKLEILIKGIQTIKNGKFWFKRETLEMMIKQLVGEFNQQNLYSPDCNEVSDTLTKRERTIVSLIAQGARNIEIAEQLHISVNTVKTHVYSIFRKTHCRNRVELIKWSLKDHSVLS
ncbi:response regulator transcription factor [Glaciecola sp. 2405UD65-10]|uniref:helix-turn-helix transcriptional regulator n=1 Tax=Glaciecola sp. 2405UD65-10 TaxID=3397244 RepID=UPI003B593BB5